MQINLHVCIVSMLDSFVVNTIVNTIHHKLRIYVNSKSVCVPVLGTSVDLCSRYLYFISFLFFSLLPFRHMVLGVGNHLRKMFILGSRIFTLHAGQIRIRLPISKHKLAIEFGRWLSIFTI